MAGVAAGSHAGGVCLYSVHAKEAAGKREASWAERCRVGGGMGVHARRPFAGQARGRDRERTGGVEADGKASQI